MKNHLFAAVLVGAGLICWSETNNRQRRTKRLWNPPLVYAPALTVCSRRSGSQLVEIRSRPISDACRVRDKTGVFAPVVDPVAGRLEREADPCVRAEIEDDLMRRAGSGAGDRTGKAAFDRTMEMPAKDALDLRVAANDLGKGGTAAESEPVHSGDSGHEGRMMHKHQGGPIRRFCESAVDPA